VQRSTSNAQHRIKETLFLILSLRERERKEKEAMSGSAEKVISEKE